MTKMKYDLATITGLVLLIAVGLTIASEVSAQKGPPVSLRQYYVTTTNHDGASALQACTRGYHMASIWEILDPSNLSYNHLLGLNQPDQGAGAPTDTSTWVRTGNDSAKIDDQVGQANCNLWTTNDGAAYGTAVQLEDNWTIHTITAVTPYDPHTLRCDALLPVYCVEDLAIRP